MKGGKMGLILRPAEIKNCGKQVRTGIEGNRKSYEGALQVVQKFVQNEAFKSQSWDTAKEKILESHQLIVRGIVVAQDSIISELSAAEEALDGPDRNEDQLIQDILRLEEECEQYIEMIKKFSELKSRSLIGGWSVSKIISYYQELLETTKKELEIVKEELNTLYSQAEQTSSLFLTIGSLLQAVECAINDAEVYISGRGKLSDVPWREIIPDLIEECSKVRTITPLEDFLNNELDIEVEDFREIYGDEVINIISEEIDIQGIEQINGEKKEEFMIFLLEQTSGQKIRKIDGKYQYLYEVNKVMLEFDESEVKDIVMDVSYANIKAKKKYIAEYLQENLEGCDAMHAAAIMGNMQEESGFSPLKLQGDPADLYNPEYIEKYNIHDNDGWGLIQWSYYSRKEGLFTYAEEKREASDNPEKSLLGDMDTQLEYLTLELSEGGVCERGYKKFLEIKTLDEATDYFCIEIERAGEKRTDERIKSAQAIWEEMRGKAE